MSKLTVQELLTRYKKEFRLHRYQTKKGAGTIVERRTLPAKRRGFTQKAKINGQVISSGPGNIQMARWARSLSIWPKKELPCEVC